jgi:ribosomal protein S18 acetylase RimI-like enzyme
MGQGDGVFPEASGVRPSGQPQLTFRPLEATDIEAISGVHHRACLIAYRFMNWSYSVAEVEAWYAEKFVKWSWTRAAFDSDDTMVGFIALIDRHLDQLFVDPAYQGRGVGSMLLVSALKAAPGRITLDVFEENSSARAFYEKHGFQARDRWMNEEEGAVDLLYVRE